MSNWVNYVRAPLVNDDGLKLAFKYYWDKT